MKKIYLFLFTGLLAGHALKAQTLTKTMNEPAVGDIHTITEYDSTSVIPKNTGLNQTWNFSSFTEIPISQTSSTFVAASSVTLSSSFPGATLAEDQGSGDYLFYKSATTPTTQFEWLGFGSTGAIAANVNFTNTAIQNIWPFAYGNTFTDSFSGNLTGFLTGSYNGNATLTATGTGSITLPGGKTYSNILQLKSSRRIIAVLNPPVAMTLTTTSTQYDYFEPGQKFPLLSVMISLDDDGSSLDTSITVTINKMITVGITDRNFDAEYAIYPNPAKDQIQVKLSNPSYERGHIEIFTSTGQLVKSVDLGNDQKILNVISVQEFRSGIYMVKTSLGDRSSTRKLVIE